MLNYKISETMNKIYKRLIIIALIGIFAGASLDSFAGNKDRSGQAGSQHLL